jgi:hypothetical protein
MNAGVPLRPEEVVLAKRVGVVNPELIRVLVVSEIPLPEDPMLLRAAQQTGFLSTTIGGLTLGHAIYVRQDSLSNSLLAHECRHVHQYEKYGSIASFLPEYLKQLVTHGYENAPLEVDARAHQQDM